MLPKENPAETQEAGTDAPRVGLESTFVSSPLRFCRDKGSLYSRIGKINFTDGVVVEAGELAGALRAVGELLAADEEHAAIVVVGGATLNLLGLVQRATSDVDVIARAFRTPTGDLRLEQATPFPPAPVRAIRTVARDFGLSDDWMNAVIEAQWQGGLPPGLAEDITWRNFGHGLDVGLVGRRTLVHLKLFASVDRGPRSVHAQDLVALSPTDEELKGAAAWVLTQDAAPEWGSLLKKVIEHVERRRQ